MRRSNQRRDAVFACYQQEVTDRPLSVLLADAKPFTIELSEGVEAHRDELDKVIGEYARGWNLNRIAPLEKNIMRVALYEMNYREDVPYEVAIDEAVETAKKFCGAEAPGFVNGILGAAAPAIKADKASGGDAKGSDAGGPEDKASGGDAKGSDAGGPEDQANGESEGETISNGEAA